MTTTKKELLIYLILFAAICLAILAVVVALRGEQIVPNKTTVIGGCDESLWSHVYNSDRLHVQLRCVTLAGTIVDATHGKQKQGCRSEADGDLHCWLKLDAGQVPTATTASSYINAKNDANEGGNLVFEPMCQHKVTQTDAVAVCKDWKQRIALPPVGSHVRATGAWVLDAQHGHMELHPITSLEVLR